MTTTGIPGFIDSKPQRFLIASFVGTALGTLVLAGAYLRENPGIKFYIEEFGIKVSEFDSKTGVATKWKKIPIGHSLWAERPLEQLVKPRITEALIKSIFLPYS